MSSANPVDALRRADVLVRERQPRAALALLAPLLAEHPDSRSVLEVAGRAYFHSAQLKRAEATFARLVAEDPSDSYSRFVLGRVCERGSRYSEAAAHYRIAVALDPRADYRVALARVESPDARAGSGSR